ncbi:putative ferric-chelate reductase 1, partial [Clarias magur]
TGATSTTSTTSSTSITSNHFNTSTTSNTSVTSFPTSTSFTSFTSSSISSSDCGISKTCVSQPYDCDPSTDSNCFFMAATPLPSGSGFVFELTGRAGGYVSVGFSDDVEM